MESLFCGMAKVPLGGRNIQVLDVEGKYEHSSRFPSALITMLGCRNCMHKRDGSCPMGFTKDFERHHYGICNMRKNEIMGCYSGDSKIPRAYDVLQDWLMAEAMAQLNSDKYHLFEVEQALAMLPSPSGLSASKLKELNKRKKELMKAYREGRRDWVELFKEVVKSGHKKQDREHVKKVEINQRLVRPGDVGILISKARGDGVFAKETLALPDDSDGSSVVDADDGHSIVDGDDSDGR